MPLQSDSQGFLTGDVVADISRVVDQLKQIRIDVRDIKRSLLGAVANVRDNSHSRSSSGGSNARNRGSSASGQSSAGNSGVATPNRPRSSSTSSSVFPPESPGGTVIPNGRGRDASGRFSGNAESTTTRNNDDRKSQGIISGFTDRIATAVKASAAGAEEADPTIKAFQEVAEPMRRGYEIFTGGGGDKKERWYKKIFKELNLFRKDESVFNQAANRSLRNIEDNPGGGGGDGDQSFLGGLLGSISPWIMAAITGLGGALLTGIGSVLGIIFSPIGLAIGAASAIAWGLFTESGRKFFGEVGAKLIAGWDVVVTAFAPITESIGKGWDTVKGGFDSLINGMVSSWDAFTGFLKDKFGIDIPAIFKPVVDVSKKVIESAKETVKSGADSAVDAVKEGSPKTTAALGNLWDKTKEGAKNIYDRSTNKDLGLGYISSRYEGNIGSAHKDNIGSAYGKYQFNTQGGLPQFLKDNPQYAAQLAEGGAPGSAGFNKKWEQVAKDDPSGFLAAQEASGRKQYYDPAMKKAGSLGFNTEDRGIQEAMFSGAVQHGGWNSKVLPRIAKNYDLKSMSAPDQLKAIYAERRKYASENLKGNDLKNVLARYDSEENNTVDLSIASKSKAPDTAPEPSAPAMASISDDPTQGGRYKYETLEGGKVQVTDSQDGVKSLASDEQANAYRKQQGEPYLDKVAAVNANNMPLYHQLAAGPVNTQVQTASTSMPKVPTFAPPPPIAEAPPIIQPLGSDLNRSMTVNMPAPDVGQDVRDRGIAHIVTGGMSGRG